jgi:hypothetical protein
MYIPTTTLTQGGGSTWTNSFTETGASLANWTQDSGSWSVVSGALHVDTSAGTAARLKFNTAQVVSQRSVFAFQADVMMETGSVGTDAPLGLLFYWSGTGAGAPTGQLFKAGAGAGTKQMRAELDATSAILGAFTPSPTWAFDVYSNIALVVQAGQVSMSLDDALVAIWQYTPTQSFTSARFAGLVCNSAVCNFKNIRLDYLAVP